MAKVFVGGLPKLCDEQVLVAYFSNFGNVLEVDLKRDENTRESRGFAFVSFSTVEAVSAALACYDQHCIGGKWVEVKKAIEEKGGKSKGKGKGSSQWGASGNVPTPWGQAAPGWDQNSWGAQNMAWGPYDQWGAQSGSSWGKGKGKGAKGAKGGKGDSKGTKGSKGMGKGGKLHEMDANKLFVGGLPKTLTEAELKNYFHAFGEIKDIEIKTDINSGQSRGFGFVTFATQDGAKQALDMYEMHSIGGKWIEVKSATVNGQPAPGQKGGQSDPAVDPNKIFVGGLPQGVNEDVVTTYFSQFGSLTNVTLKKDENGKPRGFGFIEFADDASVVNVMANYDKHEIEGKWVEVKQAQKQQGKGGGKGGHHDSGYGAMSQRGAYAMAGAGGYNMGAGARYSPY